MWGKPEMTGNLCHATERGRKSEPTVIPLWPSGAGPQLRHRSSAYSSSIFWEGPGQVFRGSSRNLFLPSPFLKRSMGTKTSHISALVTPTYSSLMVGRVNPAAQEIAPLEGNPRVRGTRKSLAPPQRWQEMKVRGSRTLNVLLCCSLCSWTDHLNASRSLLVGGPSWGSFPGSQLTQRFSCMALPPVGPFAKIMTAFATEVQSRSNMTKLKILELDRSKEDV